MTSLKTKNNWDETMENVNNALRKDTDTLADSMNTPLPPSRDERPRIYQRIIHNFERVEDMLTGDKAEEYGDPQAMCRRIGQPWFGAEAAEVDVALMMAELKIERIKYDHSKEDSYIDAIAYLAMALAFMQEGKKC